MLAVLDPVLFSTDTRRSELDEVVRLCRKYGARIPDASFYWHKLQRERIQPLSREGLREIRSALDALRSRASTVQFPEAPPRITLWDFRTMFGALGREWVDVMARLLTGCALTGEPTILITRLVLGRNAEEHSGPERCRLIEKTCWDLRVQAPGSGRRRIPLVRHRRNVAIQWTTRFDDRLPAEDDGARFPFFPPADWHKSSVRVCKTHESRPTWLDVMGSHWACPATGWGYHWDGSLESSLSERYGLSQLNVVCWGAPPDEGAVGDLHHVPRKKGSRLKSAGAGWAC